MSAPANTAGNPPGLAVVLVVTLLVQVLIAFAFTVPAVMAPQVAGDIGVAPESLGLYMLLTGIAAMVTSPFIGRCIHRFGAFRINQAGVTLVALSMLAGALGWIPMLLASAVLLGIGQTTAMPTAAHLLARVTPAHRLGVVLSIRQAGMPVGAGMAGLIVPALLLVIDWHYALVLFALVLLVAVLAEAPMQSRVEGGPHQPAGTAAARLPALMRSVMANPGLRAISICSFSYTFAQMSLMAFLVSYLNIELGYSLASAGAVMALSQGAALFARLLWGWVADRCGDAFLVMALLGVASALLSVTTALLTPAWPVWLVCIVAIALGATLTAWNGVYAGAVVRLSPRGEAGAMMGASNVFGYAGMLLGPPMGAIGVSLTGTYAASFFLAAFAILPAAWVMWTARHRLPVQPR